MATLITEVKIMAQHIQPDVHFLEYGPFFGRRYIIGFREHFQQIAQVVLNTVAEREFLAARQPFQHRQANFQQIVGLGHNGIF